MARPDSAVASIPYADLGALGGYLRACRSTERPSTVIKKWNVLTAVQLYLGRPLTEVTVADIDRWWDSMIDGGLSNATRANRLSIVRNNVAWLINRDLRADDPTRHCERPPTGRGVPRDLDPTRVKKIIRSLGDRDRDAVEIMFRTAMRRAEVAAIHTEDLLSRPGGTWLRVNGKGAKEREIPIPASLAARLDGRTGWLFASRRNPGRHLTADRLGQLVTGALREGGLQGATSHQLRHTAATAMLARTGGNLRLVQVWLGHANPATTAIYTRTTGPTHGQVNYLYDAPRTRNRT
jgi:integrase/recombinase XerD